MKRESNGVLSTAAVASIVLVIAGCNKNAERMPNVAANTTASTANSPSEVENFSSATASELPPQRQALLSALQVCSDHLNASHSPIAAQMREALQDTRDTMPRAVNDPKLGPSCAEQLEQQKKTNRDLGC